MLGFRILMYLGYGWDSFGENYLRWMEKLRPTCSRMVSAMVFWTIASCGAQGFADVGSAEEVGALQYVRLLKRTDRSRFPLPLSC